MKMVEIQRIGKSTISVREDLANRAILCQTCKGFGEVIKTLYHSEMFERHEHIFRYVVCPTCNGKSISYINGMYATDETGA